MLKASTIFKVATLKVALLVPVSLLLVSLAIAAPAPATAPSIIGAASRPAHRISSMPASLRSSLYQALAADAAVLPFRADQQVWREQKVTADDGGYLDALGWSVAIDGSTALIGAYYATIGSNSFQGAVYVFTESGGTWTQAQKLTASDGAGGDNFGTSVALDGDTALIGAAGYSVGNDLLVGTAYVFTRSNGVWTQGQKLLADDGAAVDTFGISVALEGNNALIGAHGANIDGRNSQGAVYAFTATDGVWTQTQKLVADDGAAYDQFGQQFALDGTTAVIGADQATYANDYPGKGAAYVFTLTQGVWTQMQRLEADDGELADYFARWVDIEGSTIVIGAPAANVFQGSAYVFTESGGTWTQSQKLVADDGISGDFFADAVSIKGSTLLIGAPGATIGGNPFTGAAYMFTTADGVVWNQGSKLVPSDGAYGDEFGYSVILRDGGTALIGAPHPTDDGAGMAGAAYFYSLDTIFQNGFEATP